MIKLIITTLVTEVMAQLMTGPIVRMEPAATEKILNTNATIGIQRLLVVQNDREQSTRAYSITKATKMGRTLTIIMIAF